MGGNRWVRTPIQYLETRVAELESQLEQARKFNDRATIVDILNRAGIKLYAADDRVYAEGIAFAFDEKTRQLRSIERL